MKKLISIFLAVTLILCSFSFVFADFGTTDSTNLSNIYNLLRSGGALYSLIGQINTKLQFNNIPIGQQMAQLLLKVDDMNYNLVTIAGFLDPQNNSSMSGILNQILNALVYSDTGGVIKSWLADVWQVNNTFLPELTPIKNALTNINNNATSMNVNDWKINGHRQLFGVSSSGVTTYNVYDIGAGGTSVIQTPYWTYGTPLGNIALLLQHTDKAIVDSYVNRWAADLTGYNSTQTGLSWTDIEQSISFTPASSTDGLYKWLSNIQAPVARLSYVLASDERIEAQEKAADNEQAVVDNFIDSSGSGATSTNDIGAVSDLSAGYKDSFGSDASVSGIFDIFDSDHMGWFSSETKNQLDTTTSTRSISSDSVTPLLDQQIQDIYNSLGVKMP